MSKRCARLAWALAALAAASAASAVHGASPSPVDAARPAEEGTSASPLRLAEADRGRAMTLPVGTVLRVDLDANYSTGAEWQRRDAFGTVLASVPCEGIVRAPLVKRGEPAPPVGTGTTARYCFRAAAPGRAYLYLFYGRAWTPDAPAWNHFTLDVTVTPAG
jgi:predicted secreted protein